MPTLARVCEPVQGADYPIVFTGQVQTVSQQRLSQRRAHLPAWLPAWLPFATEASGGTVTVVRFETSVRYKGEVHRHESVVWSARGRPRPSARYTVFATLVDNRLETDSCAPNSQAAFDPDRYGLIARSPLTDPNPLEGWQGGLAVAIGALALMAGAAAAIRLRSPTPRKLSLSWGPRSRRGQPR